MTKAALFLLAIKHDRMMAWISPNSGATRAQRYEKIDAWLDACERELNDQLRAIEKRGNCQ